MLLPHRRLGTSSRRDPGQPGRRRAVLGRAQPAVVLGPPGIRIDRGRRSDPRLRIGADRLSRVLAGVAHMAREPVAPAAAGAPRRALRRLPVRRAEKDDCRLRMADSPGAARNSTGNRYEGIFNMFRVLTFALVTTALAGCAVAPGTAARRRRVPVAVGRRARGRAGAQGRSRDLTASTPPDGHQRPPRRRFLRFRERHLGQEHAHSAG